MLGEKREELPLSKAAEYLLDECRMVLPGIQALFGLQLIAVFYLICKMIIGGPLMAVFAAALLLLFVGLWFVLPRARGVQRMIGGG